MIEEIHEHLQKIEAFSATDPQEVEAFRVAYLGSKGLLKKYFAEFKNVPNEQKKEFGQVINQLKQAAHDKVDALQVQQQNEQTNEVEDYTKPGAAMPLGSIHPIRLVQNKVVDIFSRIGFGLSDGPEIEDDWHNFTALNLPEHHPARDMQDTFFIQKDPDYLLRTHTSSVQIRHMENNEPPMRILSPGRVYRNEAISARSHMMFHQVEGLYVDTDVSFADLKQTIQYFAQEMFGKSKIRLRPSYFPFTEPSAEVDVYWGLETETDYKITKGTGWLEIMGCGMIDPNVLRNVNIDPDKYTGYAFGMGIDRIALLLYQMGDIRLLTENDLRFLRQFSSEI